MPLLPRFELSIASYEAAKFCPEEIWSVTDIMSTSIDEKISNNSGLGTLETVDPRVFLCALQHGYGQADYMQLFFCRLSDAVNIFSGVSVHWSDLSRNFGLSFR